MNGKPDQVIINVREYCGTYIATTKGQKVRASCTSCARWAADACADKIYGRGNYSILNVTPQTFVASHFMSV